MKTKLTIKNFRIFDENGVTVNLKPITILTGCNSSGKSSVVKAALMLNDVFNQFTNIPPEAYKPSSSFLYGKYGTLKWAHSLLRKNISSAKIDFTTYPNNLLGRFDKILHNKETGKITFEYTTYSLMISKEITVSLNFIANESSKLSNAILETFEVKTEDGTIFWMEKNEEENAREAAFKEEVDSHKIVTIEGNEHEYEYEISPKSFSYSWRVNANLVRNQFVDFAILNKIDISFRDNHNDRELGKITEDKYKAEKERLRELLHNFANRRQLDQSRWLDICESNSISICDEKDWDIIERIITDNSLFNIPALKDLDEQENIENFINDNDLSQFIKSEFDEEIDEEKIKSYIKEVVNDFLLSNTKSFSSYFKQLETEYFNNTRFEQESQNIDNYGFLDFGRITHTIISLDTDWKHKHKFAKAYFVVMFLNQKLYPKESKFYRYATTGLPSLSFTGKYFFHKSTEILEKFLCNLFVDCMLPRHWGNMTYVSSSRSTIKRIYQLDKKDEFTLLLKEYMKSNHKGLFINKWIKKFGIGESISFGIDEDGVGAKIRIHKTPDDKKGRLLADEGYGITQLLSIMLQIQMTDDSSSETTTIAIEEPEIHLHPKYQALLADMFVDAYQNKKIHFIIETHSEYLIRRLQLLVAGVDAEQKLDKDDVSISYIYTKEEAEKENQQLVKNISICEDGYLDDTFGSGFFDEASKLSRKLM